MNYIHYLGKYATTKRHSALSLTVACTRIPVYWSSFIIKITYLRGPIKFENKGNIIRRRSGEGCVGAAAL